MHLCDSCTVKKVCRVYSIISEMEGFIQIHVDSCLFINNKKSSMSTSIWNRSPEVIADISKKIKEYIQEDKKGSNDIDTRHKAQCNVCGKFATTRCSICNSYICDDCAIYSADGKVLCPKCYNT